MSEPRTPKLVVVGHVNKGKSSVVATLTENASIPVDRTPGTTARAASYRLQREGQTVLEVLDTPGFQEAPEALAWLQRRAGHAGERAQAVRDFVEHFEHHEAASPAEPDFRDEVELLRPLVREDAAVLYVIDASRPYRPVHEAEMEILRWAGQPGIALLNRIGSEDYAREWRPVLLQFFNAVHDFDAHAADLDARTGLLEALAALRSDWRPMLALATEQLRNHRADRDQLAVQALAEGLAVQLRHIEKLPFREGEDQDAKLQQSYADALRRHEAALRTRLADAYDHPLREYAAKELPLLQEDLFSETSWRIFGLTRPQLTLYAAGWGALLGGGLDLAVGGLSFGTGAVLGSLVGGAGAWFGGTSLGKSWDSRSALFRELFPAEVGRFRLLGPVQQPRLAWMMVDRALSHARFLRELSHAASAQHGGPETPALDPIAARLPKSVRDALDHSLRAQLQAARKAQPLEGPALEAWQRALLQALTEPLAAG